MSKLVFIFSLFILVACAQYKGAQSSDPISCRAQCSRVGMEMDLTQNSGCGCKPRETK